MPDRSTKDGASGVRDTLEQLLRAPKAPTLSQVWRALTKPEKTRALWLVLTREGLGRSHFKGALHDLEKRRHMRVQTLERMSATELAVAAAGADPNYLPLELALRELHLRDRVPLLAEYLNSLGIPHVDGLIADGDHTRASVTSAQVTRAVNSLIGRFAPNDIAIYLLACVAMSDEWPGIDEWRQAGIEQLANAPEIEGFPLQGEAAWPYQGEDEEADFPEAAEKNLKEEAPRSHNPLEPDTEVPSASDPALSDNADRVRSDGGVLSRVDAADASFRLLASQLRHAADQLEAGRPPAMDLAHACDAERRAYDALVTEVVCEATAAGVSAEEVPSFLREIRELHERTLHAKAEALSRESEGQIVAIVEAAARLEGPPAASEALARVHQDALRLLELLRTKSAPAQEGTDGLKDGKHALGALVRLVREEDTLSLGEGSALAAAVAESYGELLARLAFKGRLAVGSGELPVLIQNANGPAEAASSSGARLESPAIPSDRAPLREVPERPLQATAPVAVDREPVTVSALESQRGDTEGQNRSTLYEVAVSAPVVAPALRGDARPVESRGESTPAVSEAKLPAHEAAAWQALRNGQPLLAYYHAELAAMVSDTPASLPLPLARAVCLAPAVQEPWSEVGDLLVADLTSLATMTSSDSDATDLPAALQLLRVAASLRPALIIPGFDVAAQLETRLPRLWELCNCITEFASGGLTLSPDVLSLVSTSAAWVERVKDLQDEAKVWLIRQAPAFRFQFAGAASVWRRMLERGALVDDLLRPVAENQVQKVAAVQSLIEKLSTVDAIDKEIGRIDRDGIGRVRGGPILHGALRQLEARVSEAVDLARRWCQLQRVNPKGGEGWRLDQAGKLREQILAMRPAVRVELESSLSPMKDDGPGLFIPAAARICLNAIDDLCTLFEPRGPRAAASKSIVEVLSVPMLLRTATPLKSDGSVDLANRDALESALRERLPAQAEEQWNHAFEQRLAKNDLRGTRLLLQYADELGGRMTDRERERRLSELNHVIGNRQGSIRHSINTTRREIASGASRGFVREHEHNNMLATLEALEGRLVDAVDYDDIAQSVTALDQRLMNMRRTAVEEVRLLLAETDGADGPTRKKVEELLGRGDVFTATEVLQNRAQWSGLPSADERTDGMLDGFLQFLRRAEGQRHDDGAFELGMLSASTAADAMDSPDHVTDEAKGLLASWTDRKVRSQDAKLPKLFFSFLGFTVQEVVDVRLRWHEVRTATVRDRSRCPVPKFGTRADGSYRVLWLWGPMSAADIASAVAERSESDDEAVIVFYFGRLDEMERRTLRLISIQRHAKFVVLDDVLLAYLSRLRGERMAAFFACALPFTSLIPYHTLAGEVPVEMFYGRHRQRTDIESRDGTCLVYGGRQLGKTALLRGVQSSFNNRAEGRVAIYIDLKASGVGRPRNADAIWEVVAAELRTASLWIRDWKADGVPAHEAVEQALTAFIGKAPRTNRVLLLLDEADLFFARDGEEKNFENAHRFKALMDRSQRAFKVVFAGLHNVQRSTRIANHPLAHLGVPVCVGPMVEGIEWQAAVDLVEKPLASMGFSIDRDLTIRILSHTNYYPSLIQIYCHELMWHIHRHFNRGAAESSALPMKITADQLEAAYQSVELRQRVKQSFHLTLDLDPRYKVIALCVANATAPREGEPSTARDISVGELREHALYWWGAGFRDGASEEGFRALLDEMVGLGVLRRSGDFRYALRGANVPLLLGSEEEVESKLVGFDEPASYDSFEPDTYRRPLKCRRLDGKDSDARAPLTTRQEYAVCAPSNGVALLCGVNAAGLLDVVKCLESCERVSVVKLEGPATETKLQDLLRSAARKGSTDTSLVVCGPDIDWTESWIHEAHGHLRARRSHERPVRAVFIAGPRHTWNLIANHGSSAIAIEDLRNLGVVVQSATPWHQAVVRSWLEDQQLSTSNPVFELETVKKRTGFWPRLLVEYVAAATEKRKGDPKDPGDDFARAILGDAKAGKGKAEFGLDVETPAAFVSMMDRLCRELGGALPIDELSGYGEIDPLLAEKAVAWGRTLGLLELKVGRAGVESWQLEGVVAQALEFARSGAKASSASRIE